MEFGPRALGGRTIIGDARSSETQKTINLKIKYRESFRPFAPSVREENISEYFNIDISPNGVYIYIRSLNFDTYESNLVKKRTQIRASSINTTVN